MISNILEELVKLKTPTRSRDFGVLSANKKKIVVDEVSPNLMHVTPPLPPPVSFYMNHLELIYLRSWVSFI